MEWKNSCGILPIENINSFNLSIPEIMQYKWTVCEADNQKLTSLLKALPDTREVLCRIFVQRNLDSFEMARSFFNPDITRLPDPFLIKDMDKAVSRIIKAIHCQEKILLYGDYDVDGTTAVALMYQYLKRIPVETNIGFYIPDRNTEGYGLSSKGIDFAKNENFTLIITLDCGITSTELIENAPDSIDFIICDHHIPGNKLPPAIAILNPKQKDCNYTFKELCGCGIAFKLICAINQQYGFPGEYCLEYIELVAIAIGADIVTMTGENRVLCFHGLKKLNSKPTMGIRALMEVAGSGFYDNYKSVFQLAPRINAAGRMAHGRIAVELLIENDFDKALQLAKLLHSHNEDRKTRHLQMTCEALEIIQLLDKNRKTTVVHKEGWHKGVLGIVASKLQETYYRPTIVLTTQNGSLTGSARSIKNFDIYDTLHKCQQHLSQFGGHTAAAGLSMKPEELHPFIDKFEQVVGEIISDEQLIAEICIDAELDFKDVDYKLYNTLKRMEPFGPDNQRPVFITKNAVPTEYTQLLKEKHIRFAFRTEEDSSVFGIGFNMPEKFGEIIPGKPIDIVYSIKENNWNDQRSLQLHVIDFRPAKCE